MARLPGVVKVEPITTARVLRGPFDYIAPEGAVVGTRLIVPFGRRDVPGVVTGLAPDSEHELVAPRRVLDPPLPRELVELAFWLADEYCSTPARALSLLAALQAENARLRARLNHGGTYRPNCLVTPGFLISVELLADGALRVSPAWTAEARGNVAEVTGALALGEGGRMSSQQFSARASQVDQWARSQVPACGFRARVSESHGNLTLYKRQVRTVEQYFYVRRD